MVPRGSERAAASGMEVQEVLGAWQKRQLRRCREAKVTPGS